MKKWGKFLPGVSLILFFTTLILVVLTSHALAKYVTIHNYGTHSARPAVFEFKVTSDNNPSIFVDFGMDAETAPIYGTRRLVRTYDFSVKTSQSEVASMFTIELFFPANLYKKIIQADKTEPGVWVSWNIYEIIDYGLSTETLIEMTDEGVIVESSNTGTWTYNEVVPINCNPRGKEGNANFRIEFEIMNVEDTSKVKDAFIYTSQLSLNVSATQID